MAGYQGFGSFHSDNVQHLLQQSDYQPPPLPFQVSTSPPSASHAATTDCFLLDLANWTFINHGAFGAPFAHAQAVANLWRRYAELQPLRFMDRCVGPAHPPHQHLATRQLLPHLVHAQRTLASIVHCRPADLALLPNATTGLNAVLRSVLRPGDVVFSLDIGYGGVKKMIQAACAAVGATHVEATVLANIPITRWECVTQRQQWVAVWINSDEALLSCVERDMPSNTTLAVFDAITSNTALVLPMQQLTALCKARYAYCALPNTILFVHTRTIHGWLCTHERVH